MGAVDLPGNPLAQAAAETDGFVAGRLFARAIARAGALLELARVTGPDLGQAAGQLPIAYFMSGHAQARRPPAMDQPQKRVEFLPGGFFKVPECDSNI
jgi:hypothetical protein